MNQNTWSDKTEMLRALAVVATLPYTGDLPTDFYDEVSHIRLDAKSRLTTMARECLGYAEGDIVTTPLRFPKARIMEFFISDAGHLWVRVAGLKKDGSVGKATDTFSAGIRGVVKVTPPSGMAEDNCQEG